MMLGFIIFLKNVLPVLLGIFVAVFVSILLLRLVLFFLLNKAWKKYQILKNKAKEKFKYKTNKHFDKEDEELMRVLEGLPKAHSAVKAQSRLNQQNSGSYELVESEQQEIDRKELAEVKIVDIVKPVGFWTSMILGQKLTYLVSAAQIINKRSQRGFWVSMVEAKERAAGKERGMSL
jgi:uncharacterized membrane protein YgaE (UPF0421/DUF939 family)